MVQADIGCYAGLEGDRADAMGGSRTGMGKQARLACNAHWTDGAILVSNKHWVHGRKAECVGW
jgi:hypothetical protein